MNSLIIGSAVLYLHSISVIEKLTEGRFCILQMRNDLIDFLLIKSMLPLGKILFYRIRLFIGTPELFYLSLQTVVFSSKKRIRSSGILQF